MNHVVWTPFIGEILSLSAEEGNENDPYAVAVMKDCCWPFTKACAYNQGVLILECKVCSPCSILMSGSCSATVGINKEIWTTLFS